MPTNLSVDKQSVSGESAPSTGITAQNLTPVKAMASNDLLSNLVAQPSPSLGMLQTTPASSAFNPLPKDQSEEKKPQREQKLGLSALNAKPFIPGMK